MSLTSIVSVFVILSSNFSHVPLPSVGTLFVTEPVVISSIIKTQTPKESFFMEEKKPEEVILKKVIVEETKKVKVRKVGKPKTKIKKVVSVIKSEKPNYSSSQEEVIGLIKDYSTKYQANEAAILRIAKCESRYNNTAVSPSGKHFGIMQFSRSTFKGNQVRLLKEDPNAFDGETPDVLNPKHNVLLAVWMMEHKGQWHQWSCK